MVHPKVKESSSIVTILQAALQLNPKQAKLLGELEYEWYRSYQFDVPEFYSSKVATMRSLRRLLPVLEREQIKKWKAILQENRKKKNIYDPAEMERQSYRNLFDALTFLKLRPAQEKQVKQLWQEKDHLGIEECLKHLESTLDASQEVKLKKYWEKQVRLFREGQENHVRFVFDYLILNEEQFQAVVEYHLENYWREWLPLEELQEEARLMQRVLNKEQWGKYKTDWDRRMASAERQMLVEEEGNKFNLRWVQGVYKYTRDVLYPKYQTYRQDFEQYLSSEERMLIGHIREEVKAFNNDRFKKRGGEHSSTVMESNRILSARANLMPSLGSRNTKELEPSLKKMASQHAEALNEYFVKLKEVDRAYREFTASFYEEIGGTYGPNVMVHRDEDERANEVWKMNFLLLDPKAMPK
ncbi:MAG: hypothetical protein HRU41_01570 [Saprospiraceae bacterium]|nr:hypothetical protein [Saprospiraceae bacterium]